MISTIFLDNDGVLVDTEKYYFEANQSICKKYGHDLTAERYREVFLRSNGGMRGIFEPCGWPLERIAALRAERDALYADFLRVREIVLPGVAEGIELLAKRFNLCMVTSSPRAFLDIIHARTGFSRYFSGVICEQDVTLHKPDSEPYRLALRRMGVAPEEGLALEDTERGLRSAMGAGLR